MWRWKAKDIFCGVIMKNFVPVHCHTYESRNEHALCKTKSTALVNHVNDENLHIAHQKKDKIIKKTNNFQVVNERSQDHAHHV